MAKLSCNHSLTPLCMHLCWMNHSDIWELHRSFLLTLVINAHKCIFTRLNVSWEKKNLLHHYRWSCDLSSRQKRHPLCTHRAEESLFLCRSCDCPLWPQQTTFSIFKWKTFPHHFSLNSENVTVKSLIHTECLALVISELLYCLHMPSEDIALLWVGALTDEMKLLLPST